MLEIEHQAQRKERTLALLWDCKVPQSEMFSDLMSQEKIDCTKEISIAAAMQKIHTE